MMKNYLKFTVLRKEQGAALITVLIMSLLSLLLVLGASKTALFNEILTGNDADYQRALEAAQLLLKDAELDVYGYKEDFTPCNPDTAAYSGCRLTASKIYIPSRIENLADLYDGLSVNAPPTPPCINGLCTTLCPSATAGFCSADGSPRFWTTTANLALMTPLGATYGQFTLASPGATGNKILTAVPRKGWYWIELMIYNPGEMSKLKVAPNETKAPFMYRITAVAQGNKAGTQAVVQTLVSLREPE